jgi:enoyl-CoA hydratase
MLQRLAGPQTAAAMVLFGQRLDGRQMVERGLAWELVEDAEGLLARAREIAERAASVPLELLARAKATLSDTAILPHHADAVDRELGDQVWSLEQPFFARRMAELKARLLRKKG